MYQNLPKYATQYILNTMFLSLHHRALSIYEKTPEISVVAKLEFPIGKKLFHLVVNPSTWPGARPWTWNWCKLQET